MASRTQRSGLAAENGQALMLMLGLLMAILVGVLVLGVVARGGGRRADSQRAADLAALAGANSMHSAYARLFEPVERDGVRNPQHLEKSQYLSLGRRKAEEVARANGAQVARVTFPDDNSFAPVRIKVEVQTKMKLQQEVLKLPGSAVAELAPPAQDGLAAFADGGGYDGPLAYRQGKPMRPDVAAAFDRMAAAAQGAGLSLLITSAFRSDAEQAVLWNRHPDPKWVARPGHSLHRMGTELDLGPPAAYKWLAANCKRFQFIKRYSWEEWHFGYTLNARSNPRGPHINRAKEGADGIPSRPGHHPRGAIPSFVPERFTGMIARAAQRWNVSGTLLAAQLYVESNFNPYAKSAAGAQGIAQFIPSTARALGLSNPLDPAEAIDAQAHLMRDHLRQFASVPLALAAYNAGPGAVAKHRGIPPFAETRAYVTKILGLMNGAGEALSADAGLGLKVRLVE